VSRRQTGPVLPHDVAAERAVLGAILLNNAALETAQNYVQSGDFHVAQHRVVFAAMQALAKAGTPIDAVTLGNRLLEDGTLDQAGGALALGDLTDGVATAANVDHYAAAVADLAAVRAAIAAAQRVVADGLAFGRGGSAADFVERAHERIGNVEIRTAERPRTLFSYADDVRNAYKAAQAGVAGLPLPWSSLTSMTGGLRFGTVTAFVARPSVGKSTICVLIAKHAWELENRKERVLVVSPEMSAQDMAERFFITEARVPYMSVVRGQLSGFEEPKMWEAMERTRGADRLWIIDGAGSDLSEASVETAIRQVRPTLVCIDSFYDLNFPGRDDNERVRNIARWLFGSCKRHRFACVVGSQQNREQEKSKAKGGGSRLGTIAYSDAIGQRFDTIFALERDEKLKQARRIRVRPLKIRRGYGMETIELHWDFSTMNFGEAEDQAGEEFADADGTAKGSIPY